MKGEIVALGLRAFDGKKAGGARHGRDASGRDQMPRQVRLS